MVLLVAVAWSYFHDVAMCYVLPVLWLTSWFYTLGSIWCATCIPKRESVAELLYTNVFFWYIPSFCAVETVPSLAPATNVPAQPDFAQR